MQAKKVQPEQHERHIAKARLIGDCANNMGGIICQIAELANGEQRLNADLTSLGASGKKFNFPGS